jgi:hypothetical protein
MMTDEINNAKRGLPRPNDSVISSLECHTPIIFYEDAPRGTRESFQMDHHKIILFNGNRPGDSGDIPPCQCSGDEKYNWTKHCTWRRLSSLSTYELDAICKVFKPKAGNEETLGKIDEDRIPFTTQANEAMKKIVATNDYMLYIELIHLFGDTEKIYLRNHFIKTLFTN